MTRYRKVSTLIWNDRKFCSLSDDGQLLFLMLLTHPHMTGLGAMRSSTAIIAAEKKWAFERVSKGFFDLSEKGLVRVDEECCCMVLPNFLKHNPPENPNVVKGWKSALELIPECSLKDELIQKVTEYTETLPEPFRKGFESIGVTVSKASGKPFRKQEQEQEQKYISPIVPLKGNSEKKKKVEKSDTLPSGFQQFWKAYPRKKSPDAALKAWIRKHCEQKTEIIVEALERYKRTEWRDRELQFIPHPASWLNAGAWKDEPDMPAGELCSCGCGAEPWSPEWNKVHEGGKKALAAPREDYSLDQNDPLSKDLE